MRDRRMNRMLLRHWGILRRWRRILKKIFCGTGTERTATREQEPTAGQSITYPADPQTENGNGEQRNRQSDASQTAQAQVVSPQKNEGMSTGMIVLIVILCILASPVILGAASAGIGVAAGLIAAWFGLIIGFGATAAALILVLIALVAAGIISMFTHPFVGMCLIGAGLICGGIGLLFLMLTVAMAGIATPAICCWIGGLFQKRGKAEA